MRCDLISSSPLPIVTLTTDFGDRDGYVGASYVVYGAKPSEAVIRTLDGRPVRTVVARPPKLVNVVPG